jgi:ketosteroid isomerase-like protein
MLEARRVFMGSALLIAVATAALVLAPADVSAHRRSDCPRGLHRRSPEETIRQHLAFINAGDLDAAMCDYADDAIVMLPGQVVRSKQQIRMGLEGMSALLGGALPELLTLTVADSLVLITFTAQGTPCVIPDGSDTYVVEHGHIVAQTVHDSLESAPGAVCPLATP